jgi:hypothetical protein
VIDMESPPYTRAAGRRISSIAGPGAGPSVAQLTVSKGIARGVADLAQVGLARLERDLTNLGLSDAQIHRIIPAYVAKPREEEPKGTGSDGSGGTGGTGPTGPTGGTGPTGTTGGTGPTG